MADVKPAFREPPVYTDGCAADAAVKRMTLTEALIMSAQSAAYNLEQRVYIGGLMARENAAGTLPQVALSRPEYTAATVWPDGRVELELGAYRTETSEGCNV